MADGLITVPLWNKCFRVIKAIHKPFWWTHKQPEGAFLSLPVWFLSIFPPTSLISMTFSWDSGDQTLTLLHLAKTILRSIIEKEKGKRCTFSFLNPNLKLHSPKPSLFHPSLLLFRGRLQKFSPLCTPTLLCQAPQRQASRQRSVDSALLTS